MFYGGTVRTAPPACTLERILPILPHIGVTRVANVTGLDHVGVPTWMVIRPLARSLTVFQGKGLTDALAKASGIMESIELHHAERRKPRGDIFPLNVYETDPRFVPPTALSLRSDAVIAPDHAFHWAAANEIISNTERFIPHALFNLDFCDLHSPEELFISSSNGLASGNDPCEAILHGACEVIERDQKWVRSWTSS